MIELHVSADSRASSHDASLSDGEQTWYFNLMDLTIDESPSTPNTVFNAGGDGGEFGQFTSDHAHLLQRDWGGGRGQEEWDDNTKYFDSKMAWTLIPGRVTPSPQWRYADGLRDAENFMPGSFNANSDDVRFKPLLSQTKWAQQFDASATYTAYAGSVLLRVIGQPTSNITIELHADNGGEPAAAVLATDSFAYGDMDDPALSQQMYVVWDAGEALSNGVKYWFVVYSDANDSFQNHWEVAYGSGGDNQAMTNAGSWVNTDDQLYFRVRDAEWPRSMHPFEFDGATYCIMQKRDNTSSELFINGDRGQADAGSSTTTIVDATKSWVTDQWAFNSGTRVRIIRGTGRGQVRTVSGNTGTVLTVSQAFDIAPDATSEYVLVGTDFWTDISPSSGDQFDDSATSVAVGNDQVFFAFGTESGDNAILRMRNNAGVHEFDDDPGGNKADQVAIHLDQSGKVQIWRAENDSVDISASDIDDWTVTLSFGTEITVGESSYLINRMVSHEGRLWVFKEDKPYYLQGQSMLPVEIGLHTMAEPDNGKAATPWKRQILFNWAYTIEKMVGQTVDDIGPWKQAGLPDSRRGIVSALEPVHAFVAAAMDAGEGRYSSVLVYNEIGFGELYRAHRTGKPVNDIYWQSVPGGDDRMWIGVGADLIVMNFPSDSLNFLHSTGFKFHHEWEMVSSTYDMNAQQLSKLFKELVLTTQNLDNEVTIDAYFQADSRVGGTEWTQMESFIRSPHQSRDLDEGRRKKIRIRLIGRSVDADVPAILEAAVLEGLARTPVKYQWPLAISTKGLASSLHGARPHPDLFTAWLKEQAGEAGVLTMHASPGFAALDEVEVISQPPQTLRTYINKKDGIWEGQVNVVVRDA